jgi:hypothetical protein
MSHIAIIDNDTQVSIHPNSIYTTELGQAICDAIASSTLGIKPLMEQFGYPPPDTIYKWLNRHQEFADGYMRAKQRQIALMAENLVEYSKVEPYYDDNGVQRVDGGMVARQRLVTDNVKWLAARLLPKLYGDKIQSEVTIVVKHEDALGALE